ncbi:MAG: hypothetical protein N3F09_07150 [Bacteroidia bacterium]|nr:hypothetical protein [Bacteroidia bacterium]
MHRKASIVIVLILALVSCKKDKGKPEDWNGYPFDVGRILITRCATSGCHDSKSYQAAGNLDLSSWDKLFSGTSAGMPVIPYSPEFSYLMYFINSYPDLGLMQEPRMPLNDPPLSREEVNIIRHWIEQGAPDAHGRIYGSNVKNKVYVVNQGCDVVTILNADDGKPIRYIKVGREEGVVESPHYVMVSPDEKYWYVLFLNANVVQKFRVSDNAHVADIPLSPKAAGWNNTDMKDWNTFCISSDGKKGYAVAWTSLGAVSAVDLEKHKLLHYYPALPEPHGICLNKTEDTLIITAEKGNFISLLDTSFQFKYDISLQPGFPPSINNQINIHEASLNPLNKDEVWLTCQQSDDIRIFNLKTHTLQIIPVSDYPQTFSWSNITGKCYVSSPYDNTTFPGQQGCLSIVDGQTKQVQKVHHVPQGHGIFVSDKSKKIFSASRNIGGAAYPPHHTTNCTGKNGYLTWFDLLTLQPSGKKVELSVDPYFIHGN